MTFFYERALEIQEDIEPKPISIRCPECGDRIGKRWGKLTCSCGYETLEDDDGGTTDN